MKRIAPHPLGIAACAFLAGLLAGCAGPADPPKSSSKEELFARLFQCAPGPAPDMPWKMTVRSVARDPDATRVRVAVTPAGNAPIDFALPVYRLSSGRWLIHLAGRAYLLDDECREYKLKDRKSAGEQDLPPEGPIRLSPGQSLEAILVFPRMPDSARAAMLVYAGDKLPFLFGVPGA